MTESPAPGQEIDRVLTTLRLVVGGMLGAVVMLGAGAAWWVRKASPSPDPDLTRLVLMFLIGATMSAVVLLLVLKLVFVEKARGAVGESAAPAVAGDQALITLLPAFRQWTVSQGALAEGVAMLGLGGHLITGHTGGLAAAAIGAALLARIRPSRAHLERFASDVLGRSV